MYEDLEKVGRTLDVQLDEEAVAGNREELMRLLDGVPDPKGVKNDAFIHDCAVTATVNDAVRREMDFAPRSAVERVVLAREMLATASEFSGVLRKTGDPYFNAHLLGSMNFLAADQGIVGLAPQVATLNHDSSEDLKDPDGIRHRLVNPAQYLDMGEFSSEDFELIHSLRSRVWSMVTGVTKLRRRNLRAAEEATFRAFLKAALRDLRVANIKFADRSHNLSTIGGHGNRFKMLEIMRESMITYFPITRRWGVQRTMRRFLEMCRPLNPELAEGYDALLVEHLAGMSGSESDNIRDRLGGLSDRADLKFVPRSLAHYVARSRHPFDSMDLNDLHIDYADPMFELGVIVRSPEDVREAVLEVIRRLALSDPGAEIGEMHLPKGAESTFGVQVPVYNPVLGGRIDVRVNDRVSEARSRRGILANGDGSAEFRRRIQGVLDRGTKVFSVDANLFAVAEEEVFDDGSVRIRTPKGKEVVLPSNDRTVLDFAANLHPDFVVGAQEAVVTSRGKGRLAEPHSRVASIYDRLLEGDVCAIESCLARNREGGPDWSLIRIDPGSPLLVGPEARACCLRYLAQPVDPGFLKEIESRYDLADVSAKKLAEKEKKRLVNDRIRGMANIYLAKLRNLFNLSQDEILRLVKEESLALKSHDEVLFALATCKINPLTLFARAAAGKSRWNLQFDNLPDRPGVFEAIGHQFAAEGMNIHRIFDHEKGTAGRDQIRMEIDCGSSNQSDIYRLFLMMLRLADQYELSLLDCPYGWLDLGEVHNFVVGSCNDVDGEILRNAIMGAFRDCKIFFGRIQEGDIVRSDHVRTALLRAKSNIEKRQTKAFDSRGGQNPVALLAAGMAVQNMLANLAQFVQDKVVDEV